MTNSRKSALIIGASGFIGSHVAQYFSREGWQVAGLGTRPPENYPLQDLGAYYQLTLPADELGDIVRQIQPQVCIHCAGRASVYHSLQDPLADFKAHVEITLNVLNILRLAAPSCRLVFISSAAVYGNPEMLPVSEDRPLRPISPYGFHKLMGEQLCTEFHQVYGLPTATVRIFSAYGIGLRRQVLWDICQKAGHQPVLALHGTGLESRDFINVWDVARGIHHLVERAPFQAEAYNLASGKETTIEELAKLVVAFWGGKIPIEFDGVNPQGNPLNWQADISRISRLGFIPEITLAKGVKAYVDWRKIEALEQ